SCKTAPRSRSRSQAKMVAKLDKAEPAKVGSAARAAKAKVVVAATVRANLPARAVRSESITSIHLAAGSHGTPDGCDPAGGNRVLHAIAGIGIAAGGLS